MPFDHIGLNVADFARSKAFYAEALGPLGYELIVDAEGVAGFGANGDADFWIQEGEPRAPIQIAFASPDRATVDAFHAAALAAAGKDNGQPGLRPHYHEHYYGAFVHDPDGNNVEAVCHAPEGSSAA
jgi:catechol 2,3-dioxygenase-like lactoylglutathione lyase family enzyme